jgi:hypothetical protein
MHYGPSGKFKNILERDATPWEAILTQLSSCTQITIGWEPFKTSIVPVDVYESGRPPRRKLEQLQLGWIERKQVLRRISGVSDEEMRDAACEAQAIKRQRNQTLRRIPFQFLEVASESLIRKAKRRMSRA